MSQIDYELWDWLPKAAEEMNAYLRRLMSESAITPHDISVRAKSIGSFNEKCRRKDYSDPMEQVTDTVAARIITYSATDRDRAGELIRSQFVVKAGEDRNPGEEKDEQHRGYDCLHLVVIGEPPGAPSGWLERGGHLSRYFERFGGLEIQIRTVAAHAWAEFEHEHRYKGVRYQVLNGGDQRTIDRLFCAAADARRSLDETFTAIAEILANPTATEVSAGQLSRGRSDSPHSGAAARTPITTSSLGVFLQERFPDDRAASPKGLEFGEELVRACGCTTIEELRDVLNSVDGDLVRELMATDVPVTTVRRMDDELLAVLGDTYIELTEKLGTVSTRRKQLEGRHDRVRGKMRIRPEEPSRGSSS